MCFHENAPLSSFMNYVYTSELIDQMGSKNSMSFTTRDVRLVKFQIFQFPAVLEVGGGIS